MNETLEFEGFMRTMKRRFLFFCGGMLFLLYLMLRSPDRKDEWLIFDETTGHTYLADERTYNEWLRRGRPPIHKFYGGENLRRADRV